MSRGNTRLTALRLPEKKGEKIEARRPPPQTQSYEWLTPFSQVSKARTEAVGLTLLEA